MDDGRYFVTSILLAIATGMLMANGVRYLLPSQPYGDLKTIAIIAVVFSTYSLWPKPNWLNRLNWLVVPLSGFIFVGLASFYDPHVWQGIKWVLVFSMFTFFVPFIVYLIILVANFLSCQSSFKENEND